MSVTGNTEAAIEFLQRLYDDSPVVLTSIHPEDRTLTSETFRPKSDVTNLRTWIEARQGLSNLYFHLNDVVRPLSGAVKAKKTEVKAMRCLHVDLDPRKGEDLEREREWTRDQIASFTPPPSFIIFSGGGHQGFWILGKPERVNGDEGRAIELEAYNQQIAVQLGADPCHNLDRILRLPGSINVPDAKKRKRGRETALAELVEWHPERIYTLDDFTPAPPIQMKGRTNSGVKLSGNLPKADVESLPDRVPKSVRQIIVQGEDPEDLTRFPSRSEALFYVCCELVRAGVDDDTIASIIMDRDLAISSSVLDKPRSTEYAARQIQRAREEAESPELRELNDAHAVIGDMGGKCRVISEVSDATMQGRTRISRQSFEDFRNRYMNRLVQIGKKQEPLGAWWLKHPMRRQYNNIAFAPGRNVEGVYNLWRGFGCEAIPGDCSLYLGHMRDNLCHGDDVRYEYLINWMARMVQRLDSPGEVAIVLRGKMGTGKGKFTKHLGSILGRHFLQVSDPKHLVGSFNAHLRDCVLLFADEAFYAGDKKHESILKTLVTEEMFIIEGKGLDAEVAPNCIHLIMASNAQWVVPAGQNERRFFVLDVSDARIQDSSYFRAIDDQMETGGREALLHMLLTRDLSEFIVQDFPRTEALRDQQELSWKDEEVWWYEKLMDGLLFEEGEAWLTEVPKSDLQKDYEAYALKRRVLRPLSPTATGKFLVRVLPEGYPKSYQKWVERVTYQDGEARVSRVRVYYYGLPKLEDCRARWDKEMGATNWPRLAA